MWWTGPVLIGAAVLFPVASLAEQDLPLVLMTRIPLGDASGRMDHFALDIARKRLFLAELGNDSVAVIDLGTMSLDRVLTGFAEPQGVAFDARRDVLFVANGGDGTIRRFAGNTLEPAGQVALAGDADNIHQNPATQQMVAGYGNGAIAILDPKGVAVAGDIAVAGHPEGFQVDPDGSRIFVNEASAGKVAVIDVASKAVVAEWPLGGALGNFPMAFDPVADQVIVATRYPPLLIVLDAGTGNEVVRLPLCADPDDVQPDPRRNRLYVACGSGHLAVFGAVAGGYVPIADIPTANGARTAFFSEELDLLFVAARASGGRAAEVWVFRPQP